MRLFYIIHYIVSLSNGLFNLMSPVDFSTASSWCFPIDTVNKSSYRLLFKLRIPLVYNRYSIGPSTLPRGTRYWFVFARNMHFLVWSSRIYLRCKIPVTESIVLIGYKERVFVIIMRSPDLERSNLIGIIRKTRNVFKKLRFGGKTKNWTLQLTSILKRWHSHNYKLLFTNSHF